MAKIKAKGEETNKGHETPKYQVKKRKVLSIKEQ